MAKKQSTALAKTSDEEAEAAALAELSDFFDGVSVDGMEEVGGDDLKLAAKLFNMKGIDKATGDAYRKNVFFDTIGEVTQETIDAVLLLTQKSNRWDRYDNAEEKTNVLCSSQDRVTGTMADGTQRPCKGCPDTGWFRDKDGKPMRKCGPVHTVVAIERLTQRPFLIRFKKTGLKPFRNYLMKHHWGARVSSEGKRSNVPLFAYAATLELAMHDSGNYALPVLTRGPMLSRDDMIKMHEAAKGYLEIMSEVIAVADATEAKHATDASSDGFSSDDFADGGGA